jgi:hypothetical protein
VTSPLDLPPDRLAQISAVRLEHHVEGTRTKSAPGVNAAYVRGGPNATPRRVWFSFRRSRDNPFS